MRNGQDCLTIIFSEFLPIFNISNSHIQKIYNGVRNPFEFDFFKVFLENILRLFLTECEPIEFLFEEKSLNYSRFLKNSYFRGLKLLI